jgi:hypothetical protein
MGVTARSRIQPISERFRSGEASEESALPAADGFALQLDEIPNVEPMRFWVTVRNRFENDPGEIAEGHFCVEGGVLVVTDSNKRFVGSATLADG